MIRSYWSLVRKRAWQETLRALALDSVERAVLRIAGAIVGAIVVWWATKGGTSEELFIRALATAAIIALVPLVYCWKLISAPAKIDFELRTEVAELGKQIEDKEWKRRTRDEISALMVEGKQVWNLCLAHDGKAIAENEQITAWENKVHHYLQSNLEPSFFARYINLAGIPKENSGRQDAVADASWQGIRGRLVRLAEFLDEFKD
jgi:hypothetical protein